MIQSAQYRLYETPMLWTWDRLFVLLRPKTGGNKWYGIHRHFKCHFTLFICHGLNGKWNNWFWVCSFKVAVTLQTTVKIHNSTTLIWCGSVVLWTTNFTQCSGNDVTMLWQNLNHEILSIGKQWIPRSVSTLHKEYWIKCIHKSKWKSKSKHIYFTMH